MRGPQGAPWPTRVWFLQPVLKLRTQLLWQSLPLGLIRPILLPFGVLVSSLGGALMVLRHG